MKKLNFLSLDIFFLVILCSCSENLTDISVASYDERNAAHNSMRIAIDSGCDDVKSLFLSKLKQSGGVNMLAKETGIDVSKVDANDIDIFGIPILYIDSESFSALDERADLSKHIRLYDAEAQFLLYYNRDIVFTAFVSFLDGKWAHISRVARYNPVPEMLSVFSDALARKNDFFKLRVFAQGEIGKSRNYWEYLCMKRGDEIISISREIGPVLPMILRLKKDLKEGFITYMKEQGNIYSKM